MEEKMRKFWMVLLALGLVVAFSMPAFAAVDGKFSGSLRMRGWYNHNLKSIDKDTTTGAGATQFYDNRLRMVGDFKVAEGLMLTTRFDVLEKKWGDTLTTNDNNISWERAYVTFDTKGGRFQVGYQEDRAFGTVMGNSAGSKPMIKYFLPLGDFTLIAAIEKGYEAEGANGARGGLSIDNDIDIYDLGFVYKFKGGDAGLMFQNVRNQSNRSLALDGYRRVLYIFDPYVKYKAGNLYVEAEVLYATGKWAEYDDPKTAGRQDIDFSQGGAYLLVNYDIAPMYVGGIFAYGGGDDGSDATKKKSGLFAELGLNSSVNLSLMMMSYEYRNQVGWRVGNTAGNDNRRGEYSDNIWFYQVYAGVKPMKQLDIKASISYAYADKKPKVGAVEYISDKYGTEFDLTASYKIYDNLEYMVGFGYLWTGDYFKATNDAVNISNDYLLMHQLLLSF